MISVRCGITGFENPTLPFRMKRLSLTELFIHSPTSMKLVECPARSTSMGVDKDDWLLIDTALTPVWGDTVLLRNYDELFVMKWSDAAAHFSGDFDCETITLGVITLSIHHLLLTKPIPEHDSLSDLDLDSLLNTQSYSSLLCKAEGNSMLPFVASGDLLILDRQIEIMDGDAAILVLNNELVLKRVDRAKHLLYSDNPSFTPYQVNKGDKIKVHGAVRHSLKIWRKPKCLPS
ncbi:Error-prone repair protein UmuD [Vibrio chagasii]|nr:Error-prone repair protein UmuD [Vibrio chagasii]CAH6956583.1 Error-prone repair protein UmuD [Vibrio chagasii]